MALMNINGQQVDVPEHLMGALAGYGSPVESPTVSLDAIQNLGGSAPSVPGGGVTPPAAPGGGIGNFLGRNMNLFASGAKALSDIGGVYLGIKQLGLAKDAFKLQKQAYNTNLANQTQSYNTQVGDRIAGRRYNSEEERQAALRSASLPTPAAY